MTEKREILIEDRAEKFGPGPWLDEPDRIEWRSGGFVCLMHRNRMGAWCGYVGVGPGHPWHGKDDGDINAEVHGGITYADACAGHICHVPEPGEPEHLWWLGFDCAHGGDLIPGMHKVVGRICFYEAYRDESYVRAEVESLVTQAAEAAESARAGGG